MNVLITVAAVYLTLKCLRELFSMYREINRTLIEHSMSRKAKREFERAIKSGELLKTMKEFEDDNANATE